MAFRDTAGRAGLLAEHCPHRGASLFLGRNEDGGIRCSYHGWKFDIAGRGLARADSLIAALRMAHRLAARSIETT